MENYGLNCVFVRRMIRLLTKMMGGTSTMAVLLFILLLLFIAGYEVSGYFTGLVSAQFMGAFVGRDFPKFRFVCWMGVFTVLSTAILRSAKDFIAKLLALEWRKNLVAASHSLYFQRVSFFRANVASYLDNPDQRLTQDIERLCTAAGLVVVPLILAPFKIGWYSYKAYSTSDWYGPVAVYLFFLVSAVFNRFLVSRVSSWIFRQEKAEGEFRFAHAAVRTQCESIAFYGAGDSERRRANSIFDILFAIQRTLFSWQFALDFAVAVFDYVGAILSYLVIAIPIFNGKYDGLSPEDLSSLILQNGFVCIMLISSFSQIVDISSKIGEVAGNAHRVGQFLEYLALEYHRDNRNDNNNNDANGDESPTDPKGKNKFRTSRPSIIHPTVDGDPNNDDVRDDGELDVATEAFVLDNFTLFAPPDASDLWSASTTTMISSTCSLEAEPTRRVLVKSLYLSLTRGNDILVTGPSGVGKSSMLRTLFGLWPVETGSPPSLKWSVDFLNPKRVMVLPQSPYIFDDPESTSIIAELAIPYSRSHTSDYCATPSRALDEIRAAEALTTVGLSHLLRQERNGSWRDTLSGGEKQKLGFARLLYHRPSFAILDEATSSLDQESEALLYGLLKGRDSGDGDEDGVSCEGSTTTILSVAHRSSVRKFHRMELSLKGKGEWSFEEIRD